MKLSKRTVLVSFLSLLLLASGLVGLAQDGNSSSQNQQKTTTVAKVNGAEITRQELSQSAQVYPIIMTLSRQFRSFGQFLMSSEAGQEFLKEYRKYVLDKMIDQKIQQQKIEDLGISVSDQEVQKEIDKIIESNKQFSDEKSLKDYLKKNQNMKLADLKSRIKESLKSKKLREEVTGNVSVSEDEISSYYEKNKQSFKDQEGNVKALEDVRGQIKNTLKSQKRSEKFSSWLEQARKDADVKKNLENI